MLLDVTKLESRDQQPVIADIAEQGPVGAIEAQFALHDRLLFVSEEQTSHIAVVDVQRAEQGDAAHTFIGRAPGGGGPVGLALSPDGALLFATSQVATSSPSVTNLCAPLQPGGKARSEGMLLAIDVQAAAKDPHRSVRAAWAAGCSPVRVAVSASGAKAWVTARGDGDVLQFSMSESFGTLSSSTATRYKVGSSPVGLAMSPDGRELWVANSGRFSAADSGTLTCISLVDGRERQLRSGRFPRELTFLPDAKTLVVGLFGSSALQFVPTLIPSRAAGACAAAAGTDAR